MHALTPPHRKSPVSAALAIAASNPNAPALRATLSVIDCVHDDGGLTPINVVATSGVREVGGFDWSRQTGRALRIKISSRGPHPELTLLHEVGHWLDRELLKALPERRQLGVALGESALAKVLRQMARTGRTRDGGPRDLLQSDRSLLKEMAEPDEVLARLYSQWIAHRSGHSRLVAQVERENRLHWGVKFFSQSEFRAIVPQFEALLKTAGLIP
jgi:hypothetical protein